MATMVFGHEKRGKTDGEGKKWKVGATGRRKRTSGRGRRDQAGGSVISMREKIDAIDRRGGKGEARMRGQA